MAFARVQLQLMLGAQLQPARNRQSLHAAEAQRAPAVDVVLVVELPQASLGVAGLGGQPGGGRLRAPQRRVGEGQAAEQVVPVAVRAQQPGHRKPGLLQHIGERAQLLGVHHRID